MKKKIIWIKLSVMFIFIFIIALTQSCNNSKKINALILTGQNNHNWQVSSVILEKTLNNSGVFDTEIVKSPEKDADMSNFSPDFSSYDVVVMDYNGDSWSEQCQKAFVDFVKSGGGVVIYHAADNSFPEWEEYNEIIGLGGWGKRNEKSGPYVYWKDGEIIQDNSAGRGGSHGKQHEFKIETRNLEHPITKGLPDTWLHAKDELYGELRGPAKNLDILATAYSDTAFGGSGRHEPILFTIKYGEGRIFHTALGHAGDADNSPAIECAGFITTFLRGTEWAATGMVSQAAPPDFPNSASVMIWKELRPLSLDELMTKISHYEIGKSRKYLSDLSERMRHSNDSTITLQKYEEKMLELLKSEASADSKKFICKELSMMGSKNAIPVLKSLLNDSELQASAQFALDRIE